MAERGIWVRLFATRRAASAWDCRPMNPPGEQLEQALIAWNKENT